MVRFISLFLLFPFFSLICGLIKRDIFVIINSLFDILIIAVSYLLYKKFPIFKKSTFFCVICFILLSLFFGKTLGFYSLIPHWDKILHLMSGFFLAKAAREIFIKLKGTKNKSLCCIIVLLFTFSVSGLWEIWEFISDLVFKTNAQNGSLTDTMLDMILGNAGGILYTLYIR